MGRRSNLITSKVHPDGHEANPSAVASSFLAELLPMTILSIISLSGDRVATSSARDRKVVMGCFLSQIPHIIIIRHRTRTTEEHKGGR